MQLTQRQPRRHDRGYLAFLRTCMCCYCGTFPPCDAAHIRSGSQEHDKAPTGMGEKPDDRWAVPLCRSCHARQHSMNELEFYKAKKIDPFALAIRIYRKYGGTGGKARKRRTTTRPRRPKEMRQKIPSRPFPKRSK